MPLTTNQSDEVSSLPRIYKNWNVGGCIISLKQTSSRSAGSVRKALFRSPLLRQEASGNLAVKESVTQDQLWASLPGPMDRQQSKVSHRPVWFSSLWRYSLSVPPFSNCYPKISIAKGHCYGAKPQKPAHIKELITSPMLCKERVGGDTRTRKLTR